VGFVGKPFERALLGSLCLLYVTGLAKQAEQKEMVYDEK
jgi:hypothetical protein